MQIPTGVCTCGGNRIEGAGDDGIALVSCRGNGGLVNQSVTVGPCIPGAVGHTPP